MNTPSFDEIVNGVSSTGIDALKKVLGESWNSLSDKERADCLHLLVTLTKARLYEIVGKDTSDYLPILNAAFLNWKVVGKQVVGDAIKSVATQMFGFAGAFAGSAIGALIKGAV